jgi:hypothetical protein
MTDLSPVAQALVNAAVAVTGYGKETQLLKDRLAAALEALADQVTPLSTNTRQNDIRFNILRIAAELKAQ